MERTTSLVIFASFALVAAALIITYIGSMRPQLQNGLCPQDSACAGKSNGETFCENSTTLGRCVLKSGCLKSVRQQCACMEQAGIASCQ